MDSQPEFFGELPQSANPRRDFAKFRVGQKIIQIPCSVWKDGRIRADVSKYGAGEVVSRNATNLQDRVIEKLREHFGAIVEAVYQEFSRAGRPKAPKPRSSNKLAALQQPPAVLPKRHINPFIKDVWNFSKAPQWLLIRREPSLAEKLVYTRLTYAPREKEEEKICKKDIVLGTILELNQAKLANELGVRRECVWGALKSLRKRGLIDYAGNQGAKGCIRFLWHPWIPETCALNAQVSLGTERREKQREEREALGTLVPSLSDGPLAGNLRSFFSSLSSQKEERQEPAWFDEIRGVYPGTNVTGDLKRIEEWARKNKKPFTRELALNALRRHPPKKPGQREGYVYKGKFIESEKANVLAVQNPAFLLNAKRTIRHADGQTEMV